MSKFTEAKKRLVMEMGIGVIEIADSIDFDHYKTIVEALEIAERYEAAEEIVNKINNIQERDTV